MREALLRRLFCLSLLLLLGPACLAQSTSANGAPDISKPKASVYLRGFEMLNASTESDRSLGDFVNRLLDYRFAEIAKLQVTIGAANSPCGHDSAPTRGSVSQSMLASQTAESGSVYLVQGSLEFHPVGENEATQVAQTSSAPDLILNYQLLKSVNCAQESLMRRSEPVSRARLLESLTVMADAMALRLAEEINRRTKIDVMPIAAGQWGPDEQQFAAALTDSLVQALGQTVDFQPNDLRQSAPGAPADYTLETSLRFVRSSLFKLFGSEAQITLRLKIAAGDHCNKSQDSTDSYSLTPAPIRGTLSQRTDLLAKVSTAAVKGISDVNDARAAGVSGKLGELKMDDLLNRSKEALCDGMDSSCIPKPEVALLLLQQAAKEEAPGDFRAQEWTGRALYVSGKFVDSARKYDELLAPGSSSGGEDRLRLLTSSGDSWYRAQSFVNAADRYDQAAQILQQHPDLATPADINIRRSLSHRFSGDRLRALDDLLHPVGKLPAAPASQRELKHVVETLTDKEIPEGISRLEAFHDQPEKKSILIDAYQKQFDVLLRRGQYADAEKIVHEGLDLGVPDRADELNYSLALAHFWGAQVNSSTPDEQKAGYRFSGDILWPIVEKDPASLSFAPVQLLLLICDYLDDKDRERRTMALLNRISADSIAIPPGLQMDLVELEFLDGFPDSAGARLGRVLKEKELEPRLRTVGYFYAMWINLCAGHHNLASQSFSRWEDSLKGLRKNGTDINWIFEGTGRFLRSHDAPLSPRSKELLQNMIKAMEDPKQPLPRYES
jgi:tetratricopeptide (TPR) repeat protein